MHPYFHFTSNLYKNVRAIGLEMQYKDKDFRRDFSRTKALFLPPNFVVNGFEIVKRDSCELFKPIIDYLEEWYIGQPVNGKKSKISAFPITTWNANKRTLEGSRELRIIRSVARHRVYFLFFINNAFYDNEKSYDRVLSNMVI